MDSGREDKERVWAVLHLAFICECDEMQIHGGRYFLHTPSHSADSWEQSPVTDLMNRFPDTFQTVTDRSLFGPNVPGKMIALTKWLTNSGCVAQALSSLSHSFSVRQTIMSAMSQQLQSDLCVAGTSNPPQTRPTLPKLDIIAVDADQGLSEEWEAEDDVKGGPLDPREVKIAREREIKYLWDMEVRKVRRAPLRRTVFEQFGYTDKCPGCAKVRAGRKQAVDHSEQCRCRMDAILMTTTEGHGRLERARDRFPQASKEPGVEGPQQK